MCEAGAFVYAIDVPQKPSQDFEASMEAAKHFGTQLVYIHGDATDPAGLAVIFQGIAAKHHRLDVLVAAAAILGEYMFSLLSAQARSNAENKPCQVRRCPAQSSRPTSGER